VGARRIKAKPWPTPKIVEALARRYPSPAYAFFTEVRNQTGYQKMERTADAIAMSLYPSRGLELHGFEVKASRSDWLKEMRSPDKAEAIQSYCDRWWLVVGSSSIVEASELPESWGLLVPSGAGLRVKVDAPRLDPRPLDRAFVASILREAARVEPSEVRAAREEGLKRGREGEAFSSRQLRTAVAEFEAASGVDFRSQPWKAGRIGEAVRVVLAGQHLNVASRVKGLRALAQRIIDMIDREDG